MHMSLDGIISGPEGELDWATMDPEIGEFMIPNLLETVDTMILGRMLYLGFEKAWPAMAKNPASPKDIVDFANWIEDSPKVVFTHSDEKLSWTNTQQIQIKTDEDIVNGVANLKKIQGGDIVLFGGARIAQTFVRLGLVDEYRIKLEPILLGEGTRLFEKINSKSKLKLVESKRFDPSGVVVLYYQNIK